MYVCIYIYTYVCKYVFLQLVCFFVATVFFEFKLLLHSLLFFQIFCLLGKHADADLVNIYAVCMYLALYAYALLAYIYELLTLNFNCQARYFFICLNRIYIAFVFYAPTTHICILYVCVQYLFAIAKFSVFMLLFKHVCYSVYIIIHILHFIRCLQLKIFPSLINFRFAVFSFNFFFILKTRLCVCVHHIFWLFLLRCLICIQMFWW